MSTDATCDELICGSPQPLPFQPMPYFISPPQLLTSQSFQLPSAESFVAARLRQQSFQIFALPSREFLSGVLHCGPQPQFCLLMPSYKPLYYHICFFGSVIELYSIPIRRICLKPIFAILYLENKYVSDHTYIRLPNIVLPLHNCYSIMHNTVPWYLDFSGITKKQFV